MKEAAPWTLLYPTTNCGEYLPKEGTRSFSLESKCILIQRCQEKYSKGDRNHEFTRYMLNPEGGKKDTRANAVTKK